MKEVRTPIKRSKALVALSREHHEGLLLSWKIREGCRKDIAVQRISDYTVHFYNNFLAPHFVQEENILFSVLPANDSLIMEAISQHEALRKLINILKEESQQDTRYLLAFADELDKHIRFEERELFGYIESKLSAEQLLALTDRLNKIEDKHTAPEWTDNFWEIKQRS